MSDAGGGRAAFVVGTGILISRVVGLLRQTAFAYYFGAGAAAAAAPIINPLTTTASFTHRA